MDLTKHWQHIIKSSPDGITITDTKGKVLFVSDTIIQIFGAKTEKDILGTNLIDWIHPEDREKATFYIKNALKEISTSGASEYRMIPMDNTHLYLESKGKALKDFNNNIIGMIYSSRDITERKKLEKNHLHKSKHQSIELLAGSIAHDFNNILTTIMGHISLIKMDLTAKSNLHLNLDETEKAITQAKLITEQLSSLANGGSPVFSTFSINNLLKEVLELIIPDTNIEFNISNYKSTINVYADRSQLNRVLSNLFLNAIESMPDGGKIETNISKIKGFKHKFLNDKNEYLYLSIRDTGKGISKKDMPQIFDPYFSTKSRGTGLGLYSAFSIIKNHKGHLIASSNPPEGSVFSIYLPLE